jgi:ESS family glutamate:Na+ symporter
MEMVDGVLHINQFLAVTLGIIVLFVGKRINEAVAFLREFSIPEPVTGGLMFSVLFAIVYAASGVAVEFDLAGPIFTILSARISWILTSP